MSTSTLTLNFCYNSSVHDCLSQTQPLDVAGLKLNKSVSKLLRAFCRGSGMEEGELDEQARKLQIGKCFCHSGNQNRSSKLFSGNDMMKEISLRDGDYVFVKSAEEVDTEDELEEGSRSESKVPSPSSNEPPTRKTRNTFQIAKNQKSMAKAEQAKSSIASILGGDRYLTAPFFEYSFGTSGGVSYWEFLRSSINVASRLNPSELKKDGLLPQTLREKIIKVTRARLRNFNSKQNQQHISYADLVQVHKLLKEELIKSQTSGEEKDADLIEPEESEEEEEMEIDEDLDHLPSTHSSRPNTSSRPSVRSLSLAKRISKCWNNDLWKQQTPRSDLVPISLIDHHVLGLLLKIANLTQCRSSNGYPPELFKALKQALIAHDRSSKKRRFDNRWGQRSVITDALKIIQKQVSDKSKTSNQVQSQSSSRSEPPTSIERNEEVSVDPTEDLLSSSTTSTSTEASRLFNQLQQIPGSRISRDISESTRREISRHLAVFDGLFGG